MSHASTSKEQQAAEIFILAALNKAEGFRLQSARLTLPSGCSVQLDGFDGDNKVICEIYARIGKLKGSQPDKLASDFLKMQLAEKELGGSFTKIFCFASEEASSCVKGSSWLAQAARQLGIKIKTISLPAELQADIKKAQSRQKMVNSKPPIAP